MRGPGLLTWKDGKMGNGLRRLIVVVLTVCVSCLPLGAVVASAAEAEADTRPVDVFIGDSSAMNADSRVTPEQRWSRLFSDADGAIELNVAVGGVGYLVGGEHTYARQINQVLQQLDERHIDAGRVRRVFLVGGGNDFAAAGTPGFSVALNTAASEVAGRLRREFPDAQHLYIPEMAPATKRMLAAYGRVKPYMPAFFALAHIHGFQYDKNWYQWLSDPYDNGYAVADDTHLSAKGHNEAAHWAVGWVNSLDGPKVAGTVPEWDGSAGPVVRFQSHGGWGSVPSIHAAAGTAITLPRSGMTNEGHELVAWNTKADGTGTAYRPGDVITMPARSVMLYAQWKTLPASERRRDTMGWRVLYISAAVLVILVLTLASVLVVTSHGGGRRRHGW